MGPIRSTPDELPVRTSGANLRKLAGETLDLGYDHRGAGVEFDGHDVRTAIGVLDPHSRWASYPGDFARALYEAIIVADYGNRRLLARGFPHAVAIVNVWNHETGGSDRLRELAEHG
jgi:hypothetical protein